jgi:hypothetical protein
MEGGPGGPGGPGGSQEQDNRGGTGGGTGGGTFDPAQFEKRMQQQMRQSLSVTNDDEWTVIQALIQKVMGLRREAGGMGMPGPGGPGGPPPGRSGGGPRQGQSSAERQSLQKALDAGAPVAQIKDALAKYRAARKEKQAKLEAAQENLKRVLTTKQEAQAVLMGLVP